MIMPPDKPSLPASGEPEVPDEPAQHGDTTRHADVDRRVLELLVCPLTRTTLEFRPELQELISRAAGLAYPIRNGVPMMIEDAARELTDEDLGRRPNAT